MFKSIKPLFIVATMLAASLAPTAQAMGNDNVVLVTHAGVRYTSVRFDDLDISSDRGGRVLYGRLRAAAVKVCDQPNAGSVFTRVDESRCISEALSRAVRAIGSNTLAAVHLSRTKILARQS